MEQLMNSSFLSLYNYYQLEENLFFDNDHQQLSSSSNAKESLFWSLLFGLPHSNKMNNQNSSSSALYSYFPFSLETNTTIIIKLLIEELEQYIKIGDLFSILSENFWHLLFRLRLLFYLIWPSETFFSTLQEVPRYVTDMFPVFFLISIIEIVVRFFQGKKALRLNESICSLSQGIFQESLRIKVRSIEVIMYCLIYENFRIITLPWNSLTTWWLCYLGVDLGFYWAHRLAHEVNFIWAVHQAHHSSDEMSFISSLRQAVLQPFTSWLTYLPLALAVPPPIFLVHLQLTELYMIWLHTEIVDKVGPLEYILNTPSHHRVHHSRNPEYIDKNYGAMLIIWDRLFNTFKEEDKVNIPPVYGLVHPIKTFNPFRVQFHTWPIIFKRMMRYKTMKDKFGVLFYGPGWRPGLKLRLGNPDELPKIEHPIESYDPQLSIWKNAYILIHFTILIFFYHELTLYHDQFNSLIVNVGILSLLVSITSFGMLLDDKRSYTSLCELSRCLMFFFGRAKVNSIFKYGLEQHKIFTNKSIWIILATINVIFLLSTVINFFLFVKKFIEINKLDQILYKKIYSSGGLFSIIKKQFTKNSQQTNKKNDSVITDTNEDMTNEERQLITRRSGNNESLRKREQSHKLL